MNLYHTNILFIQQFMKSFETNFFESIRSLNQPLLRGLSSNSVIEKNWLADWFRIYEGNTSRIFQGDPRFPPGFGAKRPLKVGVRIQRWKTSSNFYFRDKIGNHLLYHYLLNTFNIVRNLFFDNMVYSSMVKTSLK